MQFAKLFDFPTGQLLVERKWDSIGMSGAGFSTLAVTTKYQPDPQKPEAITATGKTVYPSAAERDADFEAFGELKAEGVFRAHQESLRSGLEISFATDRSIPMERPRDEELKMTHGLVQ